MRKCTRLYARHREHQLHFCLYRFTPEIGTGERFCRLREKFVVGPWLLSMLNTSTQSNTSKADRFVLKGLTFCILKAYFSSHSRFVLVPLDVVELCLLFYRCCIAFSVQFPLFFFWKPSENSTRMKMIFISWPNNKRTTTKVEKPCNAPNQTIYRIPSTDWAYIVFARLCVLS